MNQVFLLMLLIILVAYRRVNTKCNNYPTYSTLFYLTI